MWLLTGFPSAQFRWVGTVAEALDYHLLWERPLPSARSLALALSVVRFTNSVVVSADF
jgi:hypothetical protein